MRNVKANIGASMSLYIEDIWYIMDSKVNSIVSSKIHSRVRGNVDVFTLVANPIQERIFGWTDE